MTVSTLHGDCRELLKDVPTGSVDLVIADPPYGDTACEWDKQVYGWLDELPRVLKPSGSLWCFGSLRFFVDRGADFADWNYAQDVVWEKHNGSNSFADRFRRVHELIAQFYPKGRPWAEVYKKPVYSDDSVAKAVRRKQKAQHWSKIKGHHFMSVDGGPRILRSVMCHRSEHGVAIHPTQKPAALLLPLIEYSCPPGGTILDPMAGSGSTGIAASVLDRHAILIEKDAGIYERMRLRISRDAPLFVSEAV